MLHGTKRSSFAKSYRTFRKRRRQVAIIAYQLKQSGNTRVALVARRHIHLMMKRVCCPSTVGLIATVLTGHIRLDFWSQTPGAYTTCTGMFGSGAATGTVNTPRVPSAIRLAQKWARPAWSVAAAGATRPRVVGRRPAPGTSRRSEASTTASALP
jgi:hypothetical protein